MEMECDGGRGVDGGGAMGGRLGGESARVTGPARMSGRELRDYASEQQRIASDELNAFATAMAQHHAARGQLEARLEQAWAELLPLVVPGLDAPTLPQALAHLGLPEMDLAGLARRSQARRAELGAALAELERDPEVARAAEVGRAFEQRRRNLDALLGTLADTLVALEAEPDFHELVAARYGTRDYAPRWWHPRRQRHRRQARRILRRHAERLAACSSFGRRIGRGTAGRFAQLYTRYLHGKSAQLRLQQARTAVVNRAAELSALGRRRQELQRELTAVPEWALAITRSRVRQALTEMPEVDRLLLLAAYPGATPLAQRLGALEAHRRHLQAARVQHLERPVAEAERALAALEGLLAEFRGPGRKLDALHLRDEVERRYGLPLAHWREMRRRHEEQTVQIVRGRELAA
jgi:hypothetical protein